MNAEACVLFLVVVMVSAGVGTGYAVLADEINISGFAECYCDVAFTSA